ncbi:Bacterial alpha-L-rhamnosidase [Pirellulimonas nuda]|uniref:alpha-L-rhamnosidase n=1 Tax=Pirellulimonas nuda TaxID=2528009 RepID=A0A518DB21_9BACT|nr:family 78 glycoside hydrolase catalytic domain [Pirellulimonas nuda]QDU88675.1 Bacterial alpha-L-rhamnosidase [Pirellulimonas nuda]
MVSPVFARAALGCFSTCLIAAASTTYAAGGLNAERLRCEHRTAPLGVDVARPSLSWIVTSEARDQRQTAYQVQVASTPKKLSAGQPDLWDSGRVESDETLAVRYAGKPLKTNQRCFWRVRVWDRDGQASEFSDATQWTTGLLSPSDWQGDWIGFDAGRTDSRPDAPLDGASWIWAPPGGDGKPRNGSHGFAARFDLPADARVESAEAVMYGDDSVRMFINGDEANCGIRGGKPFTVDVSHLLRPGMNQIRLLCANKSPKSAGVIAKLTVTTDHGGRVLLTNKDWAWVDAPKADWETGDDEPNFDQTAAAVAEYGKGPWGKVGPAVPLLPPPACLRADFGVDRPVKRAIVYAAVLGDCELRLNGERVSEDYFPSGWTDYTKRVYYRAYDVTKLIRQGQNAAAVVLADGWYSGHIGWGVNTPARDHYAEHPRFAGQLVLQFEDGGEEVLATGADWVASTGGTREADFLQGETFVAEAEPQGWDAPGFDDSGWSPVEVGADVDPVVQWHPAQPVRELETFEPVEVTEPTPGAYVLNLGQNFAGVPRIRVKGAKPGQVIKLRFAERLNPDGTVYLTNMRTARATDTYVCRGDTEETWQPRHTFHGFQYIEVRGLGHAPSSDEIVGVALSSDTPAVGSFECSDAMLNQLVSNVYWTQRMNFIDIPTDCPQRDERLGWTGDAQVYIGTACLNCDVQAFFGKWMQDMLDSQRADGQFPMISPTKVAGDDGGPAWADAGVICPMQLYETYGDRELLARQYPSMKRFVEFCRGRSKDGVLPPDQFHCFGDWLSVNADTPKDVIYTAYYAQSTRLTAEAAEILGFSTDAKELRALHKRIKQAFQKKFVKDGGRIEGDTQCCYALALAYGLVDGKDRQAASRYLVEDIKKRGGRLSTGFIGTKDLMLVLSKIGRQDVAYDLLFSDKFPGWGFSIKQGATSIWERWDGWTPEQGFQSAGMNSFAHYSFGAVYRWMVENIGGIRPTSPGYATLTIAPEVTDRLEWAKTSYDSVRGPIASDWRREEGRFLLNVSVPANTTAQLRLPKGASADGLTESGKPWGTSRDEDGVTVLEIGSGDYRFEAPMK